MSDDAGGAELEAWQRHNDEHLATSLQWLRLRLRRLAQDHEPPPAFAAPRTPAPPPPLPPPPLPPEATAERRSWLRRGRSRPGTEPIAPPAVLHPARETPPPPPAPAGLVGDGDVQAAEDAMRALEDGPLRPALELLGEQLGLSRFERDILLLGAAVELAPGIGRLCGAAQAEPDSPFPTFALAFLLFDDPVWEALSPDRPLRGSRLLEVSQAPDAALVTSPFRAVERIVNYLKGLNQLDERLAPFFVPLAIGPRPPALPPSQAAVADRLAGRLAAAEAGAAPVVHLVGVDGASKQLVAHQACARLGRHLLRLPVAALPTATTELELFTRLWQREHVLLPLALYLDASDLGGDPGGTEASTAAVSRLVSRTGGVRMLDAPEAFTVGAATVTVDVTTPTRDEQRTLWADALGGGAGAEPAALAAQFDLSPVVILDAARAVADEEHRAAPAGTSSSSRLDRLWDECLAATRPRLDTLAQRIEPMATWDDLVLPDDPLELLRLIIGQVRHRSTVYDDWGVARRMNRGLGISALFTGESGTGKTMAAEVVAGELRLDLYRIDLSAVVSKYIGETEKNLRRVFDAAESGGAIILFDEADALFGKRSEVKDSHDRYANIEINYLLQRMEAYGGLAILATNRRTSLDPAFVRRLRFVVEFPFPAAAERERIWMRAFTDGVETAPLDLGRLGRLTLSGGSIHNVALAATFAAAAERGPVTMPLVLAAVGRELRKQGRPVNEAELRWDPPKAVVR